MEVDLRVLNFSGGFAFLASFGLLNGWRVVAERRVLLELPCVGNRLVLGHMSGVRLDGFGRWLRLLWRTEVKVPLRLTRLEPLLTLNLNQGSSRLGGLGQSRKIFFVHDFSLLIWSR